MGKPSKKWRRMATMYKRFAQDWPRADFSDAAAVAMYNRENGSPLPQTERTNGYALGKKWMEVTLAMWREDIAIDLLSIQELLDDDFPEWFLKKTGIMN
ncbi:MAG: hypothetical protein GY938_30825 [Ketobacter sp.]|nr:hypothetical protein [Ketobacter sp.]